ncbi:MAG: hypothetical protein Q8P01_03215 [bacterium]|nr:hypothetical protein [bacterium]
MKRRQEFLGAADAAELLHQRLKAVVEEACVEVVESERGSLFLSLVSQIVGLFSLVQAEQSTEVSVGNAVKEVTARLQVLLDSILHYETELDAAYGAQEAIAALKSADPVDVLRVLRDQVADQLESAQEEVRQHHGCEVEANEKIGRLKHEQLELERQLLERRGELDVLQKRELSSSRIPHLERAIRKLQGDLTRIESSLSGEVRWFQQVHEERVRLQENRVFSAEGELAFLERMISKRTGIPEGGVVGVGAEDVLTVDVFDELSEEAMFADGVMPTSGVQATAVAVLSLLIRPHFDADSRSPGTVLMIAQRHRLIPAGVPDMLEATEEAFRDAAGREEPIMWQGPRRGKVSTFGLTELGLEVAKEWRERLRWSSSDIEERIKTSMAEVLEKRKARYE